MTADPNDSDEAEERENRIWYEIVVDAYGPEEQALSWYYYLEEKLPFPFEARCIRERDVSPLHEDEIVRVIGLPDEESCMNEMFVTIEWGDRTFGVPLSQLEGVDLDEEAQQAIADWHYWAG